MIVHYQHVTVWCSGCGKWIETARYEVPDGQEFCKVDISRDGWQKITAKGNVMQFCPKHDVVYSVVVDGKLFEN